VFSGIVERVGRIERLEQGRDGAVRLAIAAVFRDAPAAGASIAVNGACLTVERSGPSGFEVTAVPETLRRTTLGSLRPEARVNLERALRVGDELGGHWVQGHVDAVAEVASVSRRGSDVLVRVRVPEALRRFVAAKGSIAIDGISLTVAAWEDPCLTVALIPYTLEHTIASEYEPGSRVNLEADVLARYLERLALERRIA